MRKRAAWLALLLALLPITNMMAAEERERFATAVAAYNAGEYGKAHDEFYSLARIAPHATLYFNAGNAAYSAGQYADAALRYREALELEPTHAQAVRNLAAVERQAQAMTGELKSAAPLPWLNPDLLVLACAAAGWMGLLGAALFAGRLLRQRPGKTPAAFMAVGGTIAALVLAVVAVRQWQVRERERPAVIMAKTTAHAGPSEATAQVSPLPPATSVLVLSTRGEWSYARLPNGAEAWVRGAALKQVPRRWEMAQS